MMNIKKLASLLFQRSVIVALLIFLQAAMLLLYMLWFSSDFIYVYWGCVVPVSYTHLTLPTKA